jgi:hypothetical protein
LERESGTMADDALVARLEERVLELEDALRFYATPANWEHREVQGVFEAGPAVDGGERAREALMWGRA